MNHVEACRFVSREQECKSHVDKLISVREKSKTKRVQSRDSIHRDSQA